MKTISKYLTEGNIDYTRAQKDMEVLVHNISRRAQYEFLLSNVMKGFKTALEDNIREYKGNQKSESEAMLKKINNLIEEINIVS